MIKNMKIHKLKILSLTAVAIFAIIVAVAPMGIANAQNYVGSDGGSSSEVEAAGTPIQATNFIVASTILPDNSIFAFDTTQVALPASQALQTYKTEVFGNNKEINILVSEPALRRLLQASAATTPSTMDKTQAKLNQFTYKFFRVQQALGEQLEILILAHNVQNSERSYLKLLARQGMDTSLVSQAFDQFNSGVGLSDGDFYKAQTIVNTRNGFDSSGNALVVGDAYDTIRDANNAIIAANADYQSVFATLTKNFKLAKRANHHLPFFSIPAFEDSSST